MNMFTRIALITFYKNNFQMTFNRYFLWPYCLPDTELRAERTVVEKADAFCVQGVYGLVGFEKLFYLIK